MKLTLLEPSEKAIIKEIHISSKDVRERLSQFGLQVGLLVEATHRSPFGGPRAYRLSQGIFALDPEITNFVDIQKETP